MNGDDSFPIEIRQPANTLTMNFSLYVDGVGFVLRTLPIPFSDPDRFMEWLEHTGQACSHSTPAVWLFQGVFPNGRRPNDVFIHITWNMHEVSRIMTNPKLIRVLGAPDAARLVPLDPITGDARLSATEFNDWVGSQIDDRPRQDFSDVGTADWSAFENMLQQAANNNNDPQEGDPE